MACGATWFGRLVTAIAAASIVWLAGALPATAQKASLRIDGLYAFQVKAFTGTLAIKAIKGGAVFDLATVSPKGTTCSASGKALGGQVMTFRRGEAGFRLTVLRDQITIGGLLGRVSETSFCGLNGLLTGPYKRRGPLDADAQAALAALERAP